jgi:hypothetical protein
MRFFQMVCRLNRQWITVSAFLVAFALLAGMFPALANAYDRPAAQDMEAACSQCKSRTAQLVKMGSGSTFRCVPVHVLLVWDFTEQEIRSHEKSIGPSTKVRMTIEEKYTGCLELAYQSPARKKIVGANLSGPYPPEKAMRKVKSVTAEYGLSRPATFFGDEFTTASTSNTEHFYFDPAEADDSLNFGCSDLSPISDGRVRLHRVYAREEMIASENWSLIVGDTLGRDMKVELGQVLSCQDIVSAMRSNSEIARTIPFHDGYKTPYNQGVTVEEIIDGTVTIRIGFKPVKEPGLQVSPPDGLIASGPDKKGQYKPDRKTYTLTNTGREQIQYKVNAGKNWVTLSPKSGVLPPKGSAQVVVGVKASKAKGLGPGQRQDTVRFTNVTNGKGNTARPVKLVNQQKWRVTWIGWDTLYFGGNILAGGIKPYWEVRVDFIIEDGKYKQGTGAARFIKFEQHSHPPGVYDCEPMKGYAIDAQLNKHPTPYIEIPSFSVPGSSNSSSATLQLPKENFYLVDYYCVMDSDRAKEALGAQFGKLTAKDMVKHSSKYKSIDKHGRPLPWGTKTIPLQDGWKKSYGSTKSMDAHFVEVKRIE